MAPAPAHASAPAPAPAGQRARRRVRKRSEAEQLRAIEQVILRFLARFRVDGAAGMAAIAGSRNLWREVNSLTLLELVSFIEHKFAIQVRPIDFAPQNFSSVATIARFIAARRPRTPPAARR